MYRQKNNRVMILRLIFILLWWAKSDGFILLDIIDIQRLNCCLQLLSFDKGQTLNRCTIVIIRYRFKAELSILSTLLSRNRSKFVVCVDRYRKLFPCVRQTSTPHLTCHWLRTCRGIVEISKAAIPSNDVSHFRDIYLATSSC